MGMPATKPRRWTREQVLALIDANPLVTPRYELVDGVLLVTPAPRGVHQFVVRELLVALDTYLTGKSLGEVLASPSDVELEDDTLTQPDVFVLPAAEALRLRREPTARSLLLAVEVLSPGSTRDDRGAKRELYVRRIPEYWIVDADARLFERWRAGDERPEIIREVLTWTPPRAREPFVLDLRAFFSRVFAA